MDSENFFEIIKENTQINLKDMETEIKQNTSNLIAHMMNPEKSELILSDSKKTIAALFLIKYFFKILQSEDIIETFLILVGRYADYCSNLNFKLTSYIYGELFYLLNKFNRSEQGYIFFSRISNSLDKNKFYNTKSYAVYFAYQLKQYDLIDNIKNSFFIQFQSEIYAEAYDFSMMNFYKGLIFLSEKEFYKASICFISVFKVLPLNDSFTHFHIDSMKRLILLRFLLDDIDRNYISQIIEKNKTLLLIKPLEVYVVIYHKFRNKNFSLREIQTLVKENTYLFKYDKTNGLIKICLREILFNKISHVMKSYKRIRLDKLSSIVEIEKNALINHLKDFTKLNVQLDEVDEIVHVLNYKHDTAISLDKLRTIYDNIITVEKELINVNFKKSEQMELYLSKMQNEENLVGSKPASIKKSILGHEA